MLLLRSPLALLLPLALGCSPSVTQNTSQGGSALSSAKEGQIMCMWNAYGKRQYICSTGSLTDAQENCDKKASQMREESSTCTCTDEPDYIKDMCDDGVEPPVTSGWHRR